MKKLLSLLAIASLTLTSCIDHETNLYKGDDSAAIKQNAESVLGQIVRQDWSSINQGKVKIIANAPLNNIVKVQILTEAPFGNPNAKVLNEAEIINGHAVTLKYDAPNVYERLIAACINDKGIYYVQSFGLNDTEVDFEELEAGARLGRAAGDQYPTASDIVLGDPLKSYNALRAEATLASETHQIMINDGTPKRFYYKNLYDESWANDRLWAPVVKSISDWHIEREGIYKEVANDVDMSTVQAICDAYLQKSGGVNPTNGRRNNWKDIAEGNPHFKVNNNYLISDGKPLIITPVQMYTTDGAHNTIYYYYFDPQVTASMTSEEEANYIKSLPKFKALKGKAGNANFYRNKEYLLPYYGNGNITKGITAESGLAIPEGYKIGFLNRKDFGNDTICSSGCVYGDGRLNVEVNHLHGHFLSAIDKNLYAMVSPVKPEANEEKRFGKTVDGMSFDSPRIALFSANQRTYMCFEDGSDCNFCDMIIEITQGAKTIEEAQNPETSAYTMCFEDRLASADYDMNDVVLQASRTNETTIKLSIIACGANDEIQLQIPGYEAANLVSAEVHALFNVAPSTFINTKMNATPFAPISEDFTVDANTSVEDFLKTISLKNLSTGKTISVPESAGEPPYAIIVPNNFAYPQEKVCIKTAYPKFTEWVQTNDETIYWYQTYDESQVYSY